MDLSPPPLAPIAAAPILATLIAALAAFTLLWRMRRQGRERQAALRERDRALAAEQAAIRTLRLAAIELRAPAMTLLGHADSLIQSSPAADPAARPARIEDGLALRRAAVTGLAMQVLNLADELQDHATGTPASRVLRPEPLALEAMLRDAIVAVDALLGPSRRHWRLAPELRAIRLQADRRALAQVLARVLGNAARLSRDQDWIDIRAIPAAGGIGIAIEDEGAGLPVGTDLAAGLPGDPAGPHPASRGVGLGLALARSLMAAHGGSLTVDSISQVGSRVVLRFPASCLLGEAATAGSALP